MTRRIRVLPDRLANQIAAGEVVERPASVVKELVENALDAGATRVTISLRNGGKTEIRVADDGSGMGREDAVLSLDRHATSKIVEEKDLAAIRTLGFRGEALPSIAAVSRLNVETSDGRGEGTRLRVTGGSLLAVEECARRRGTTVTVRTLFFNVPARAKFLRSAAAETRAVSEVVTVLALANPRVGFTLESNDRRILELGPDSELRARLADIWDREMAEEYTPVSFSRARTALSGLIQRPHAATPGSRRTYLFVNGRPFTDRSVLRAAERGYTTTVAQGIRPSLFLFLEVPDGEVDVNVHPAKAEVRFRDRKAVEAVVEEGVRRALGDVDSTPTIGARAPEVAAGAPAGSEAPARAYGPGAGAPGEAPGSAPAGSRVAESQMSFFMAGAPADDDPGGERSMEAPLAAEHAAPPLMWQLHRRYILSETRSGLIIVDQHAAHERILYEELMAAFDRGGKPGQRLLFPLTIRLSPAEFGTVEELSGILARAGFEIEPFGGRSVIVHAVPDPHPYFDAERSLREMISELTHGSALVDAARNQHQRLCLSFACKAAIKAGQALSREEMAELFDRLFATELPYHDVHGRPTVIQLSLQELDNRFRRSG